MGVEHYLNELLYRYNCVVIPGFGAFLTQKKSAVLHKASNTFYPPTKILSFNKQLTSNDGLLVSYMAQAEKKGYEVMLRSVNETVKTWNTALQKGERLPLPNVGELWKNSEGKILFQPSEKVNYLTSSFGLAPFVSKPVTREVLKEEVVQLEEKIPFTITPEARKSTTIRPYLKYAAIFLLALSTGLAGYTTYQNGIESQQMAQEDAQEQVSKHIQEATFFDTSPLELPVLNLNIGGTTNKSSTTAKGQKVHHIIAGAFRFKTNADKKIRQLKRRGFNPSYIGTNKFGLYMVAYESFTDSEKALSTLKEIRQSHSKDAWLKSVR
ncbi:SPOR domain-containing protein [Aggregatimonas sangjinii]|uniref:SPOR domain-containing protein n=1 Tax=Aggregatimonas sangjinii TaxID=2583587 RepID=A0A5B7SUH7_9FLAO|nr:SPOR domain-containing protein [Aggregatimonas sangjinii]QCX01812.1 SPOR domain-containing protein [Aggregatimonas sangjinii]